MEGMHGWPECTGWTYRHSEWMGRAWTARVDGVGGHGVGWGTQGHPRCFMRGTQTPRACGKDTGTHRACTAWTHRHRGCRVQTDRWTDAQYGLGGQELGCQPVLLDSHHHPALAEEISTGHDPTDDPVRRGQVGCRQGTGRAQTAPQNQTLRTPKSEKRMSPGGQRENQS